MLKKKRRSTRKKSSMEESVAIDEDDTELFPVADNEEMEPLQDKAQRKSSTLFNNSFREGGDGFMEAFKDENDLLATPAGDLLNVLDSMLSVAKRPCVLSDLDLLSPGLRETVIQLTRDQQEVFEIAEEAFRLGGRVSHAFDVKSDSLTSQASSYQKKINNLILTFEVTRKDLTNARQDAKMTEKQLRDENQRLKDINENERRFWENKIQDNQRQVDITIENTRREMQYLVSEAAQSTGHSAFARVEELENEVRIISLKLQRKDNQTETLEHDLEVQQSKYEGIHELRQELNDVHKLEMKQIQNFHNDMMNELRETVETQECDISYLLEQFHVNGLEIPPRYAQRKRLSQLTLVNDKNDHFEKMINNLREQLSASETKHNALQLEHNRLILEVSLTNTNGNDTSQIEFNKSSLGVLGSSSANQLISSTSIEDSGDPFLSSSFNQIIPKSNIPSVPTISINQHQQQMDALSEECNIEIARIQEEADKLIESERQRMKSYVQQVQNASNSDLQTQVCCYSIR